MALKLGQDICQFLLAIFRKLFQTLIINLKSYNSGVLK